MNLTASRAAAARASDADHAAQWPKMRASIHITHHGLTYRSTR